MSLLEKWKQRTQDMESSSPVLSPSPLPEPGKGKEPVREKNPDKMPDDETDFWENGQCFECAHWIQVHRYCTWNQGGYIISWKKCQGRAFAEIREE